MERENEDREKYNGGKREGENIDKRERFERKFSKMYRTRERRITEERAR